MSNNKKIILSAPLNGLSFGAVSLEILKYLYKNKYQVSLFPIGGNVDISAYKVTEEFGNWLKRSIDNRYKYLSKDMPSYRLWHFNGSETKLSNSQILITFYECDDPTLEEINIANHQEKVFIAGKFAGDLFETCGASNVDSFQCNFNNDDFYPVERNFDKNIIHFHLGGKFENRKQTVKIVQAWKKLFKNNRKFLLTCCIDNTFIQPDQMNQIKAQLKEDAWNIQFLPYLKTNKELNDLYNNIDFDLTGLSAAEGWNLPSFNITALGKWSFVQNHTAHKDWATTDNCILVEPKRKVPIYDGMFFKQGEPFNQGNMYGLEEDEIVEVLKQYEGYIGKVNENGKKLVDKFNIDIYSKIFNN